MIKKHISTQGKNLVLFSGGADSLALLNMMYDLGQVDLALHFNHHLRGEESDQDEVFCQSFCEERKIPFKTIHLNLDEVRKKAEGDEALARELRLSELKKRFSDWNIYLAHHADDAAETFLMRAWRGANSGSLCGLRKEFKLDGLKLYRPLLDYSKQQIIDYLKEKELSWREDSSNQDTDYCRRNLIRNKLMPELKQLGSGLKHTLKHLRDEDDFLFAEAAKKLEQGFNTVTYLESHPALHQRMLRIFCQQANASYIPGQSAVERLLEEAKSLPEKYKDIPMGDGIELRIWSDGEITLPFDSSPVIWNWKEQDEIEIGNYRFSLNGEGLSERFAINSLEESMILRTPQKGDKLIPFGRKKPEKVSKLLSNAKLSHQDRESIPILCVGEEIIWIPGVKRANFGLVEDDDYLEVFVDECQ